MLIYMSLNSNILTHIALVPTISTNGWKSMVSGSQIRPAPKVRIMQITPYEYVNINPLVFLPRVFWASLPALYSPEEVFLIR